MKKAGMFLLLVLMLTCFFFGCSKKVDKDTVSVKEIENTQSNASGRDESQKADSSVTSAVTKAESEKTQENTGEKAENKEPVQITIWHDKEEAVASVLQAELDKLAPEIKVTLVKKEGLTDSLKLVGNDPKSAPDMYFFAHDKIGLFAEMGILAPITDFIPKDVYQNYMDVTVSASTYKGEIYQLPLYYETLLFMYNKAYMSADQVPKTTEELYQYMKANTTKDRYGFVEQHSTAYYSVPWIHGFGGSILDNEGKPGLASEATMKALAYHKKFIEFMPGESDYNTVNILFMEGKANSIIGGPWLVPSVRKKGIDLGFAAMPTVDETGLPLAPYSGSQGIQVLKVAADTKKEAIIKILTQLTNPEIGIALANASGCAPANKKCYEDESVKQDEMVMMMKSTAEKAVPMPNVPELDVMWSVTGDMLTAVNMGGGDPVKEAKKAQKNAEELIAAMQ